MNKDCAIGYAAQPGFTRHHKRDWRKVHYEASVAALEDKLVQYAVVTILNQIYEEDFLGFSYGFRRGAASMTRWMRCRTRS